ncbi:MAG: hypothetical protein ACE5G1_07470 [bacterium]
MARLQSMPPIEIQPDELLPFGTAWNTNDGRLSRTPPYSSLDLGTFFDRKVGSALAQMLGTIPVVSPSGNSLVPAESDCVEVGPCRIIGGVRPQNFDVGYRPDGVRFAFDSKTLNDSDSVRKNYQNMINDLGTEATTVHIRFPYAIVAFLVAIPIPCLQSPQKEALTETLERLTLRSTPLNNNHKAEAITLVLWDPDLGKIDANWPRTDSPLRIEKFSDQIESTYKERYKGLPPHN